jgi:signal transduction histidine kinase
VLTSFTQLGAVRLRASRALICLIDGSTQHILAEATPHIPLRADSRLKAGKALWLGNVSIPRRLGVCELLLDPELEYDRALVINDLANHARSAGNPLLAHCPSNRFYAGVPMLSPHGAVIGTFCVFGDVPREDGISEDEVALMEDLAATIVEYLETYRFKENQRRSELMVKGLSGFIEGDSIVAGSQQDNRRKARYGVLVNGLDSSADVSPLEVRGSAGAHFPFDITSAAQRAVGSTTATQSLLSGTSALLDTIISQNTVAQGQPEKSGSSSAEDYGAQNRKEPKSSSLQESILPPEARAMFSRAANVLRESSGLDGVVIFDASIAAFNQSHSKRAKNPPSKPETGTPSSRGQHGTLPGENDDECSSSDTSSSSGSTQTEKKQVCQILGFSDAQRSSTAGDEPELRHLSLAEHSLRRMLRTYSAGKILNFNEKHELTTSDESDSPVTRPQAPASEMAPGQTGPSSQPKRAKRMNRLKSILDAIQQVAPAASSVAFVPLWDYERSRWFACCLCWTHRNERLLYPETDLLYMKAFGNSIMTELSRLDAKVSAKAKTTFVASISHELRSPLHGILGSTEFLANTNLDPFQVSMIHSIVTCGRTLLDTLDHIMDFAKINEITDHQTRTKSITQLKGSNAIRISANRRRKGRNVAELGKLSTTLDLSRVTEEVIESVFASQSYGIPYSGLNEDGSSVGFVTSTRNQLAGNSKAPNTRKLVLIILDIPRRPNWLFQLPAGVWRRLVMNLAGNALKYTESGFIRISIDAVKLASKLHSKETQITLTVRDSGIGMSSDFLANKLFSAFTQENDLSSGVGLGLHIVRQLTETVGGKIDFQSQVGIGTEVSVKFDLLDGETVSDVFTGETPLSEIAARLRGRKICIVDTLSRSSSTKENMAPPEFGTKNFGSGPQQIVNELEKMLTEWLEMDVMVTEDWQGHDAEFVICTEPSFSHLASIRTRRAEGQKVPITVFVALDAIEAASLRHDARVLSRESVVEICPQP